MPQSGAIALIHRPLPQRALVAMILALLALSLVATNLGAMRLSIAVLWQAQDETLRHIWLNIRLPRVLLATQNRPQILTLMAGHFASPHSPCLYRMV